LTIPECNKFLLAKPPDFSKIISVRQGDYGAKTHGRLETTLKKRVVFSSLAVLSEKKVL
jgi:hypothetical protein